MADLCEETTRVLGPAPCDYVLLSLGSLSRDEMLPYSDLEYLLVIAPNLTPKVRKQADAYFYRWVSLFHFKVLCLGETGKRGNPLGLHIDEGGAPEL